MDRDWRIQVFICSTWALSHVKELCGSVMGSAFLRFNEYEERVKAIYHCTPQQLFVNLFAQQSLHHEFSMHSRPKLVKHTMQQNMVIEFLKLRLPAGSVFSLPWLDPPEILQDPPNVLPALAQGPAEVLEAAPEEGIVPLDDAVALVAGWAYDVLELASGQAGLDVSVKLAREHKLLKFFKVISVLAWIFFIYFSLI